MTGPHPQSQVTHQLRGYMANQNRYISTSTRPMVPKVGRMLTQDEGAPPKKSRNTSILQSHGNSKTSYFLNHRAYGLQTQQDAGYSVVITIDVCAERNWLIQVSSYFHPSLSKKYISNMKEAVKMQRKASARQK